MRVKALKLYSAPVKQCVLTRSPLALALVLLIQFVSAWVFYSFVWSDAPIAAPDSGSYLRAAQDLSDFRLDELQERAPGYPLLLLLTGSHNFPGTTLFFVSLGLHFASVCMLSYSLYSAGLKLWSISSFSFILLLPPYVEPAAYILSEVLAEILLVVAVIGFHLWHNRNQERWIVLSSVAIGGAALTRPTYQLVAIAIVVFLIVYRLCTLPFNLTWKKVGLVSLILLSGSIAFVGGYASYNLNAFGQFTVTPKFGLSLSTKTARVVERLPDEFRDIREVLVKERNEELIRDPTHRGSMYIWTAVPALTKLTGLPLAELSNLMLQLNLILIKRAPLTYLQEVAWSFINYLFPASGELSIFGSRVLQLVWALLQLIVVTVFGVNLTVFLAAMWVTSLCVRTGTSSIITLTDKSVNGSGTFFVAGLALTVISYTAIISCFFEVGDPRYRVTTDSLILFFLFVSLRFWLWLIVLGRTLSSAAQGISARG